MKRTGGIDGAPKPRPDHLKPGTLGVLGIPAFRRLFVALGLSSFGDWLGFLATTALATQLVEGFGAKSAATGGVLAFRLLPAVLFGPLAGAFADRFDRRITMVVTDVLRCVLFLSIPLVGTLTWLLAASFLVEMLSLFWIPAKEASVPHLVPRDRLEHANQLSIAMTYGSAPVAAAVFGVLGLIAGASDLSAPAVALYINAGTFLFAAFQVSRLKEIPRPKEDPHGRATGSVPSILSSIREGIRFARTSPLVRGLLVGMLGALAAAGVVIANGPLFARTVLDGGEGAYALLFGSVFVGIALGVGLGPRVLGELSRRRAFGPAIFGAGMALVGLALIPVLALVVLCALLVGAFAGLAYVIGLTLLGGEVEDEVRGRSIALVQSLMRIDLLLVLAVAPQIARVIGQREVGSLSVNGISVTILLGGLLAMGVGIASLRQMDDRKGVPLMSDFASLFQRRGDRGPSYAGLFLALEGGEGAGKSTQARLLVEWLAATGREVVVTREPGATPVGERVRSVLLDPATGTVAPRAEALLYAADRAQHVATVVRPALERGAIVITDRYVDSSLAYQGGGRELSRDEVAKLSQWATEGLRPDLTVLLDVDPATGLARARGAGGLDRIEQESLAFHERVRAAFLALAAAAPERYLVVPADRPAEEVAAQVRARVEPLVLTLDPAPVPVAGA